VFGESIAKQGNIAVSKSKDIVVPRKLIETGQSKFLKIEKLKPSQQTTTKISTGGLPYQDKGGLQLKRFDVTTQAKATSEIDRTYRIKSIQRGVKGEGDVLTRNIKYVDTKPKLFYDSKQDVWRKATDKSIRYETKNIPRPTTMRGQSQHSRFGFNAKEVISYETQSGSGVLLQEQKTKQLLSIQIKQLAKTKSPSNRVLQAGEVFKKQQLNLQKGLVPQTTKPAVPSTLSAEPTLAETIGKSQGRDKVVQKILDKARAKAEASKKTTETLIKPKPATTQFSQPQQLAPPTTETTTSNMESNIFTKTLNKKKPRLILPEETIIRTEIPKTLTDNVVTVKTLSPQMLSKSAVAEMSLTATKEKLTPMSELKLELQQGLQLSQSLTQQQKLQQGLQQGLQLNQALAQQQGLQQGLQLNQALVQEQSLQPVQELAQEQITQPIIIPTTITTPRPRPPRPQPKPQPIQPIRPTPNIPVIRQPKPKPQPKEPPPRIPPPLPNIKPRSRNIQRLTQGFSVWVRERGVFKEATSKAFSFQGARDVGAFITSNTPRATFTVRPSSRRVSPVPVAKKGFFSRKRQDFYKKGDLFIEKREKRISTAGELEGITRKGILASKNKKLFERMKL
jgi:hypothetical protein